MNFYRRGLAIDSSEIPSIVRPYINRAREVVSGCKDFVRGADRFYRKVESKGIIGRIDDAKSAIKMISGISKLV